MTTTSKLEASGEDGVEVTSTGGECSTNHAGGNKAVNGHGVLRLLHADQSGSNPADPGGNSFNDCSMEDGNREVGGADAVDGGVGAAYVGLRDLNAPEDLDQAEDGNSSNDLSNGSDNGLLFSHVTLNT